jgi:RNA polymerase sigma-70 factor (ECF subfamily)
MPTQSCMQEVRDGDITRLLNRLPAGNKSDELELISLLYKDLRRLARYYLAKERPGHTLQPTALVNEAYLRLAKRTGVSWRNRDHFFADTARQMRRILVDYARCHNALRRPRIKVPLESVVVCIKEQPADLLAVHEALDRLATWDPRQAQIVEMRFFGGLSIEEIATELDLGARTVKRDLSLARAWLYAELTKATPHDTGPLEQAE